KAVLLFLKLKLCPIYDGEALMTTKSAPYHAHIYYESHDSVTAERLHQELSNAQGVGDFVSVLFVGEMRDQKVGPHPKPQFEVHFHEDALPKVLALIKASGLTGLVHPLTLDDLG